MEVRAQADLSTKKAVVVFPDLGSGGGAEKYALVLAVELARLGFQTIVATADGVAIESIGAYHGEDVSALSQLLLPQREHRPGERFVAFRDLWQERRWVRILTQQEADLMVSAEYRLSLHGLAKKNVYLVHFPHQDPPPSSRLLNRIYTNIMRRLGGLMKTGGSDFLAGYQTVVANSRFTARHVLLKWGREASVLYPPCPPVPSGDVGKERWILSVGRFEPRRASGPHKAQDVMVEAFRSLTDLHESGWRLVLAGTCAESGRAFVEDLKRRSGDAPVVFRTNVSQAEMNDLYARSSLYWHAQGFGTDPEIDAFSQEHFGMSTVEAMSAKCVPVVYDTAGPHEVVEGVPGVGRWTDVAGLLSETRRIAGLDDRERMIVGEACMRRAKSFSRDAFRKGLINILEIAGGQAADA